MAQSLLLEGLTISGNSVSAAVCILSADQLVSEELAKTILTLRPTLAEHTCKHRGFGYFGDKLIGTALPHLVEHLAIDFLVETACQDTGDDGVVAGTTRWLDRQQAMMQVRISSATQSTDEICTAISNAVVLVNSLLDELVW